MRYLCGIESEGGIPTASAFSRFLVRLRRRQDHLGGVFHKTIDSLKELLPGLGKDVVVDSTDVHAYASRYRKPSADPAAAWGAKQKDRKPNGERELYRWLGYKLHLLVCGDYELPLGFKVTAANKPDGKELIPLLEELKTRHPQIGRDLEHVVADAVGWW